MSAAASERQCVPQSGGRFEYAIGLEVLRKFPLALWIVLLAALALRVGWGVTRPVDDAAINQLPDQREYLDTARTFLNGEGLSFADPRFGQRVYAHRTPGYPLLIAATGGNIRITRIVQAILDTSTVLA